MKNRKKDLMMRTLTGSALVGLLLATMLLSSCSDDPKPVNEEELITTLIVDLNPAGGGDAIQLKFYDEDGDGAIDPVVTPGVAQLAAGQTYEAVLTLKNESETPAEDVTLEIEEEKNDHLFCFVVTGTDVTIGYDDEDDNSHPVGLSTTWTAGDAGDEGTVKITLKHQPEIKTGACPGPGDTDIEVTFNVQVVE